MIKVNDLTNDEKCIMAWLNGSLGPTTLTIGGEYAQATLSPRAALAMLSLIGRGLVAATNYNQTGRTTYKVTEAAAHLKGKVTLTFLNKHGKWSMTTPQFLFKDPVEYHDKVSGFKTQAVIIKEDEGWFEIELSDKSRATVRPSKLTHAKKEDTDVQG